jgi:hypothetical protein
MRDAVARYDAALARDCLGSGCAHVGPLAQQSEYLDGISATAVGIVLLAVALFFAVRRAGWIGSGAGIGAPRK